jgi:hypothetical protein
MITNRELDVIGLGLAAPAAPAREPDLQIAAPPAPDAPAEYDLVCAGPPYAEGWTLRCRRAGRVAWTLPLAPRGAAPRVRPAVAQAVAVRVLTEQGVFVSGWNLADDDGGPRFVARTPHRVSAVPA